MRWIIAIFVAAFAAFLVIAITAFWPLEWAPDRFLTTESAWAWAQVWAAMLAIAGTGLFGLYHQQAQRQSDEAAQLESAYILSRDAAALVIKASRLEWGTVGPEGAMDDAIELARYAQTWAAWGPERYEAYLDMLSRITVSGRAAGDFMEGVITIRGRLKWVKADVGPHIGTGVLTTNQKDMLARAADSVIEALIKMKAIADGAAGPRNTIKPKGFFSQSAPPGVAPDAVEHVKQLPFL